MPVPARLAIAFYKKNKNLADFELFVTVTLPRVSELAWSVTVGFCTLIVRRC